MLHIHKKELLKGLLMSAVTLATGIDAMATPSDHVLDLRSRIVLQERTSDTRAKVAAKTADGSVLYDPMVIEYTDEEALDELCAQGVVVFHKRGGMALCCVPRELDGLSGNTRQVTRASLGRRLEKNTDVSRSLTGVDAVHNGLPSAQGGNLLGYDGKGVVVGLCDVGFDPGHIAFKGRVAMMSTYVDTLAQRTVYAPGSMMATPGAELVPDTPDECHGSHVANIMAGGRSHNPYSGAAPESTIAASMSCLSDVCLLSGIEDIIAFAKEQGKPAVINLSMGSIVGPRDGSDLFNQYIDLLGKEAVIVLSAGNDGASKLTYTHEFTGADFTETAGTMFESSRSWDGFDIVGGLGLWSADATPFQLQFVAWDQIDKKYVYTSEWLNPAANEGGEMVWELAEEELQLFQQYFPGGSLAMMCGVNPHNNRFNMELRFKVTPEAELPGHHWARYIVGWRARAPQGLKLFAHTEGRVFMRNYGVPGMVDGNADMSISDLVCNRNTIAVGSWNTRTTVPVWGGGEYTFTDYQTNTSTWWSSYGTLDDGRQLPHICAPGNYIVSAMNGAYIAKYPDSGWIINHRESVDGKDYYWFSQCGTSMASPMAAGVFALWLEADPDLGVEDVRAIAAKTANRGFSDIDNPRWGAGALDAAAGLREVLARSAVSNITAPVDALEVTVNPDRTLTVTAGGVAVPYHVYNMQGIDLGQSITLQPGIYIVSAMGQSRRVLVK